MLPLIYINLQRDAERHRRMQSEFSRLGLHADRQEAVLWTALSPAEQARLYSEELNKRQFHKTLSNGEKGCYASHLQAWKDLIDSTHEALVVLEDDVRLEPQFAEVITAIGSLPRGWDMIKLIGHLDARSAPSRQGRAKPLCPGYQLVEYKRVPSLTAGYVISRAGAAKLLQGRIPFGRPIDVDLRHWWETELCIQGVSPAAIALDETSEQSSIGAKTPDTLAMTWRKFRRKARYTLLNYWHRR
ncbi:MAG: glycosyltransferase family 25 protein [Roseateles sp.]